MAEIGAQQGVLEEGESLIFRSLMRFPKIAVADIMTPRAVVIAFPENVTVGETLDENPDLPVTRIPVYREKLDHATGFVLRTDLLLERSQGRDSTPLADLKRPLATISDTDSAKTALDRLLQERLHVALVMDKYGSAVGILTLEDIIETLIGLEIVDEHDTSVDMQKLARERWKERAKKSGLEVE